MICYFLNVWCQVDSQWSIQVDNLVLSISCPGQTFTRYFYKAAVSAYPAKKSPICRQNRHDKILEIPLYTDLAGSKILGIFNQKSVWHTAFFFCLWSAVDSGFSLHDRREYLSLVNHHGNHFSSGISAFS